MKTSFLDRAFRKLRRKRKSDPTAELFETLRKLDLEAQHIVDIGANHGNWSREALRHYPLAKVTMFEPQTKLAEYHADLLENKNVELRYAGLGDFDGSATFTIHDRDDSSSFVYSKDEAKEKGFNQVEIDVVRLDTAMDQSSFGPPQIVKIDAEGFDLQVIEGAKATISSSEVVLIEAAVCNPQYDNTVLKVIEAMDRIGMTLWNITDLNRTPNKRVLWLIEAVFVPKNGRIHSLSKTYD